MAASQLKTALAAFFVLLHVWTAVAQNHWVDLWGTMPQLVEPANLPPAPFVSPASSSPPHSLLSIQTDNPHLPRTQPAWSSKTPPSAKQSS